MYSWEGYHFAMQCETDCNIMAIQKAPSFPSLLDSTTEFLKDYQKKVTIYIDNPNDDHYDYLCVLKIEPEKVIVYFGYGMKTTVKLYVGGNLTVNDQSSNLQDVINHEFSYPINPATFMIFLDIRKGKQVLPYLYYDPEGLVQCKVHFETMCEYIAVQIRTIDTQDIFILQKFHIEENGDIAYEETITDLSFYDNVALLGSYIITSSDSKNIKIFTSIFKDIIDIFDFKSILKSKHINISEVSLNYRCNIYSLTGEKNSKLFSIQSLYLPQLNATVFQKDDNVLLFIVDHYGNSIYYYIKQWLNNKAFQQPFWRIDCKKDLCRELELNHRDMWFVLIKSLDMI